MTSRDGEHGGVFFTRRLLLTTCLVIVALVALGFVGTLCASYVFPKETTQAAPQQGQEVIYFNYKYRDNKFGDLWVLTCPGERVEELHLTSVSDRYDGPVTVFDASARQPVPDAFGVFTLAAIDWRPSLFAAAQPDPAKTETWIVQAKFSTGRVAKHVISTDPDPDPESRPQVSEDWEKTDSNPYIVTNPAPPGLCAMPAAATTETPR